MRTTVTKAGDGGETSLFDGTRVSKASVPIEALGLEPIPYELAADGMARALAQNPAVSEELRDAESLLAVMMADIAEPGRDPLLGPDDVAALEQTVALLAAPLPDGFGFDLPGANPSSAQLHVARTVVRRCERALWRLRAQDAEDSRPIVADAAMAYLNRLSDLCFVCALIEARDV